MIRFILRIGLMLVVGLLLYNYFLGTPEEKASSERIFNDVKDLGKSAWALLKQEKEKLDEGKYDEALTRLEGIFASIKGEAEKNNDQATLEEIRSLEYDQQKLKDRISTTNLKASENKEEKKEISTEWQRILDKTEKIMEETENKKQ